jgi:RimJ/RimL family protein N-acetyltransferase
VSHFSTIKTSRLLIDVLGLEDKKIFQAYRSLPEVYQFQTWKPPSLKEVEDFIRKNSIVEANTPNSWLQLGLYLYDHTLIGDIGLHFLEDGEQAEIGYTLATEHQGQGYAFEAVEAILEYLFNRLAKHRVTASVDPENIRSIHLLEKLGFRHEGHFKQSIFIRGEWYDDVIYAMLQEEWKARR